MENKEYILKNKVSGKYLTVSKFKQGADVEDLKNATKFTEYQIEDLESHPSIKLYDVILFQTETQNIRRKKINKINRN